MVQEVEVGSIPTSFHLVYPIHQLTVITNKDIILLIQ